MKTYIVTMDDQGEQFTEKVRAVTKKEAIRQAKIFSSAMVINCELKSEPEAICHHCGKPIKLS